MSESWVPLRGTAAPRGRRELKAPAPRVAPYALSLVFVALAALAAFVVKHLVEAPSLALVFVLPVVASAAAFGWGPSLTAAVAGVAAFDFLFTRPYYSLRIASPGDIWAAALLLVIAGVISAVAAQSRRRALAASEAAEQAGALQGLAHLVIQGRPEWEVLRAATDALERAFGAPAVILLQRGSSLAPVAGAGPVELSAAERDAALGALQSGVHTHGGDYPFENSAFDFWPVATHGELSWVLGVGFARPGVRRPVAPERFIDTVRGYVAAAVATPQAGGAHG